MDGCCLQRMARTMQTARLADRSVSSLTWVYYEALGVFLELDSRVTMTWSEMVGYGLPEVYEINTDPIRVIRDTVDIDGADAGDIGPHDSASDTEEEPSSDDDADATMEIEYVPISNDDANTLTIFLAHGGPMIPHDDSDRAGFVSEFEQSEDEDSDVEFLFQYYPID